ncbi:14510_t:CDS:1, partial [Dentiscutata heterogama]
ASSVPLSLTQSNLLSNCNLKEKSLWSHIKWAANNKKDIFWRLLHNAIPIGPRLAYVAPTESQDCPWCPSPMQTIERFSVNCRISQKLWELSYKIFSPTQQVALPATIDEIVTASNAICIQPRSVMVWLHIT